MGNYNPGMSAPDSPAPSTPTTSSPTALTAPTSPGFYGFDPLGNYNPGMSAPESPAAPSPAPSTPAPTATAPSATTNDPLSQAAIDALYEQNQQAYWTMMNVQNALDGYESQQGSPSAPAGPSSGQGPSAPTNTPDTTVAPSPSPAPDFSSVNYDTPGGSGSEGGSGVPPVPVTLPVFGETTPAADTPQPSALPYYGFSESQGQNIPAASVSAYAPSTMSQGSTEVPITDFSKFSFPTQPTAVTSAAPSVQDIYPLFDTGTNP